VIIQRSKDFQARQDTENAVIATAGDLGVQMAANHNRRKMVLSPSSPRENIADSIGGDDTARGTAPLHKLIAHDPVVCGQG
jgi:hypothetical protein